MTRTAIAWVLAGLLVTACFGSGDKSADEDDDDGDDWSWSTDDSGEGGEEGGDDGWGYERFAEEMPPAYCEWLDDCGILEGAGLTLEDCLDQVQAGVNDFADCVWDESAAAACMAVLEAGTETCDLEELDICIMGCEE